jgi:hypothetical protein
MVIRHIGVGSLARILGPLLRGSRDADHADYADYGTRITRITRPRG